MARARNIKPGFFKNPELVELPYEYRLLFIGLWCLADREGRLEDRPKQIRMELFPADDVDVDAGLQALHNADLVVRYTVEARAYVWIPTFLTHQHPHLKEAASTIPPYLGPVRGSTHDLFAPTKDGAGPVKAGASPADSLNPDSLNPESSTSGRGRATRLPRDWKPTAEQTRWAAREMGGIEPTRVDRIAESFRDYWVAKPGRDGTKLDWDATWRNWIRREGERGPAKGRETVEEANRRTREAMRRSMEGQS